MMKNSLIVLFVCLFGPIAPYKTFYQVDYCWKDFVNEMPEDVFAGGEDLEGHPIYIAQILNSTFTAPAKMYVNTRVAYYEYKGEEYPAISDIKVLCIKDKQNLEWMNTTTEELKATKNANLIIGGFDSGLVTYVGRAEWNGENLIGKVLISPWTTEQIRDGLHVTSAGYTKRFNKFQVLVYNNKLALAEADYEDEENSLTQGE